MAAGTRPDDGQNFFEGAGEAIQNWFESRMGEQLLIVLAIAAGAFLIKYLIYVFRAYLWSADKRAVFQYRTMVRRVRKRLMRKRRGGREHYASLVISFDVMRAIPLGV